jgi:two-component system, NtrC family, response regulator AtoC
MWTQTLRKSSSHPASATSADTDFPAATRKSPTRVLVVDDEPLVRWSIAETLGNHGYEVAEAGDSVEAVRALTAPRSVPDIVLLDLRLPDCSDLDLLSTVRRLAPSALVILMTAFGTPEVRKEAEQLGAFRVIDKPFDLDGLESLLADALGAERPH